ncbi:hypothetical protein OC834_000948 [Tilletia horrida]|nr:hypothetical protein OC834_000948 [Tilletia horrida]
MAAPSVGVGSGGGSGGFGASASASSMVMLPAFHALTQQHRGADGAGATPAAPPSQPVARISLPPPARPPPPAAAEATVSPPSLKMSKKINARLQLAAALIEADNAEILRQAELAEAAAAAASSGAKTAGADGDDPAKAAHMAAGKSRFGWLTSPRIAQGTDGEDAQADDEPHIGPPPIPQPRLASQSVIFAPFRDTPVLSVSEQRAQRANLANRLSRLELARSPVEAASEEGRRPSIDFLGVTLPTERRARTRSNSLGSRSVLSQATRPLTPGYADEADPVPRSRTNSAVTGVGEAQDEEAGEDVEALSDWGVDKFLTTEERERVQSARESRIRTLSDSSSRPLSFFGGQDDASDRTGAGASPAADSIQSFSGPAALRFDSQSVHARSEFATEATGIPTFQGNASSTVDEDPSGFPVPRYRRNKSAKPADLELLARIKMYRERQETLPPSQWDGPGPQASEQDVKDHILQSPVQGADANLSDTGAEAGKMSAAGSAAARLLDDLASQTPQQRLLPLLQTSSSPGKSTALDQSLSASADQEEMLKTPSPGGQASGSGFGLTSLGLNLRAFTKRKSSLDMIKQRLSADVSSVVGGKDGQRSGESMTPSLSSTTMQSVQPGIVDSRRPRLSRLESDSSDPDVAFSSLLGRIKDGDGASEAEAIHTRDASHRSQLTATHDEAATAAGASIPRPESSFGVVCDSWSDQGDGAEDTDDDDMPLGQIQQARLSRTQSQLSRANRNRTSMISNAETVTSPGIAVERIREEEMETVTDSERGMGRSRVLEPPARQMSRSASDDRLSRLEGPRPGFLDAANTRRPASQMLPSLETTTTLMQQAEAAGLPFPRRPFAGGSIPRPASVGPGTLLTSDDGESIRGVGVLAEGARIEQDPFNAFPLGPSPFPMSMSPSGSPNVMRGGDLPSPAGLSPHLRSNLALNGGGRRESSTGYGHAQQGSMSTKQLQELAKQATFPSAFGISAQNFDSERDVDDEADPLSPGGGADAGVMGIMDLSNAARKEAKERAKRDSNFFGAEESDGIISRMRRRRSRSSSLVLDQLTNQAMEQAHATEDRPAEPIVRQNGKILLTMPSPSMQALPIDALAGDTVFGGEEPLRTPTQIFPAAVPMRSAASVPALGAFFNKPLPGAVEPPAGARRVSVDDSFTSPPSKGPLKPLGLAAREPKALIMPAPLQGSEAAPQMRLTHNGVEIQFEVTPPPPEPTVEAVLEAGEKKNKKKKEKEKDVSPETLQGPRAPEGFVLHDVRGTAPLRALLVHSAAPTGSQITRPTLPAKPKKHDIVLADFLSSDNAARIVRVPASAPSGIGRRAADKSTILFRNHLVQHDEERDGWGWDAASNIVDEHGQTIEPSSKKSRAERRAEKKALKVKRARKKARRRRRALRAQADEEGKSYADVGVEPESPVEDLDLSSDTTASESEEEEESDSSDYDSDDEKRWVDENRPAGKLFGKSLLDVAEQKRENIHKKSRFYGQTELEEHQALEREAERLGVSVEVLSSRSTARSFRDNPLGYNDTRERMQATFGEDKLWQREMAKRQEEDAREAEERELKRLAEEEFQKAEAERKERKRNKKALRKGKGAPVAPVPPLKSPVASQVESPALPNAEDSRLLDEQHDSDEELPPPRSRTPIDPPTLDVNFNVLGDGASQSGRSRKGPSDAAAEWFARSSDEDDDETSSGSEDEAARRKAAMQRARLSRSLGGFGQGRVSFAFGEEDSDNEERGGGGNNGRPLVSTADTMVNLPSGAHDDESSGDDLPLAQIKKHLPPRSLADGLGVRPPALGGDDSSDEDLPLAAIKAKEHRKKMSMGTLDLDFWAGANAAVGASARSAGPNSAQPSQSSQPSSMAPSPQILQSGTMPGPMWSNPTLMLPPSGLASQYAPPATDDGDSDEDRPLGAVYANGAEALAAARAAHAASDDEEDEDDRPLGTAYPQAAIIAEQAALIQRLQRENDQARLANSMSMYGSLLGAPGMPMMNMGQMGMGMGMGMSQMGMQPRMGMGMGMPPMLGVPGPASVMSGHSGGGGGGGGGLIAAIPGGPPIDMGMGGAAGVVHPKVHQIDSWRHSVRPEHANSGSVSPVPSGGRPA